MDHVAVGGALPLPLILFFGLFVVVGMGMWVNIIWGLLTGGPRDRSKPGQPFLYDRVYYLLFLFMISGWSFGLLSFGKVEPTDASGFMIGWGVTAIGIALIFLMRRDMMLQGARYLAREGFVLLRPFHFLQAIQLERIEQQGLVLRFVPMIFLVAGVGVLLFNLLHLPQAIGQAEAGASALIAWLQAAAHGQV